MKNKLAVLAVVVGLFMVSVSMFAHHSAAIYDREHPVTLQGTATNLAFINPHVQVHFEVKDENGNVVKWVAGSDPPMSARSASFVFVRSASSSSSSSSCGFRRASRAADLWCDLRARLLRLPSRWRDLAMALDYLLERPEVAVNRCASRLLK